MINRIHVKRMQAGDRFRVASCLPTCQLVLTFYRDFTPLINKEGFAMVRNNERLDA